MKQRDQFDGLGDKFSEASAMMFEGAVDVTRQEFAKETEVEFILQRYGVPTGQGRYGEVDTTVDLQEAIRLQSELAAAYGRLPETLRQRYGNWAEIIAAADAGELRSEDLAAVDGEQNAALDAAKASPEA